MPPAALISGQIRVTKPLHASILRLAWLPGSSSCGRLSHKVPAERDRATALHDDTRRELDVKHLRSPEIDAPKTLWRAPKLRHG